jgi:hypothetical protein
MATEHLKHWTAMARPPVSALKQIKGGRLQGMTDVNPQWRYEAMTAQFGMCGVGWRYTVDRLWTEVGIDGEVLGFAQVSVYVKAGDNWSEPVPGVGGNHLVTKEKAGLRNNDECWKMAVTDALSVALKMLGVAADIYAGRWDGSKYAASEQEPEKKATPQPKAPAGFDDWLADLESVAVEGTAALESAWKKSKPDFRKHLMDTNKGKWEAIKVKAAQVKTVAA